MNVDALIQKMDRHPALSISCLFSLALPFWIIGTGNTQEIECPRTRAAQLPECIEYEWIGENSLIKIRNICGSIVKIELDLKECPNKQIQIQGKEELNLELQCSLRQIVRCY